MNEALDSVRSVADSAMLILIWLVQLIIYPAFRSIEPAMFRNWHHRYMTTISFFVIPLMLLQAVCIGLQLYYFRNPLTLAAAAAVITAWLVTFSISAPCHQQIQKEGPEQDVINRLLFSNWIRTACWSFAWLTGLLERH